MLSPQVLRLPIVAYFMLVPTYEVDFYLPTRKIPVHTGALGEPR